MHGISYENLSLFSSASPSYNPDSKEEEEWDDSIDANNPDNFNDEDIEEE